MFSYILSPTTSSPREDVHSIGQLRKDANAYLADPKGMNISFHTDSTKDTCSESDASDCTASTQPSFMDALRAYKDEASALARKQLEESNETKEIVCGIDEKMDHLSGKLNVGNERLDSLGEQLNAKLDAIGNTVNVKKNQQLQQKYGKQKAKCVALEERNHELEQKLKAMQRSKAHSVAIPKAGRLSKSRV